MNMLSRFLTCLFLLLPISCTATEKTTSFEEFWLKFREASLNKNYTELAGLVKLPLEVKGVDDETPSKYYDAEQLETVFPCIMEQIVYVYVNDEPMEQSLSDVLVEKTTVIINPKKTTYRLDQFQFEKIDGKWLLTRAYLEE